MDDQADFSRRKPLTDGAADSASAEAADRDAIRGRRDAAALVNLPDAEAARWTMLWAGVAAVLASFEP